MNQYEPDETKTAETVLKEVEKVFGEKGYSKKIKPMTLEASVVRLSDIIAYIGRDIEDAIIVGSIKREDIPESITNTLGNTNAQIVNTLILDVIKNGIDKPYLKFSDNIFRSLIDLKEWNSRNIYNSKEARKNYDVIEKAFNNLYYFYLEKVDGRKQIDITDEMNASEINLYSFINSKSEEYKQNTDIRRVIIDYISGQTDKYFLKECEMHLINLKI